MNQMNVAGMNPGVGGPVGGVPMVNNGSMLPRNDGSTHNSPEVMIINLNTYIYDYFLKRGYHDCARALVKDESIKLNTEPPIKTSPGQRREGDVNGVDGDGMMTDGKDGDKLKIPEDLPRPNLSGESQSSSFLLDWFSLFWEFFWSQRKKGNSPDVRQYLQHNQNIMRLREQQQNNMYRNPQQMMPGQMGRLNNMRGNGIVPNNLQKAVLQNNTGGFSQQQFAAQLQQKNQQAAMMQMQREHSDIDMNGHRPPSPSSAENAPSPSKRPRLEGNPINGQQLAPNGRGQGQAMPGQQNPMMMQNGLTPRVMNPNQFGAFQQSGPAAQPKPIQVYAQNLALHHSRSAMNNQGVPNGLMNTGVMPNQADLVPMPDGPGMYQMNGGDFYGANGQMAQVRPGVQTPGGQHGNHALQDYQMQLMLLEQQNKRRLMMARQEQDSMSRGPDGQPLPGQQGQQQPGQMPPGTSPQGSRAGASPIPNDQMKRNTPKIAQSGLPNSPNAPDAMMQGRGSPASMNFTGQLPPEMAGQFYIKNMQDGIQGPNGMRPPSSNPTFTGPSMGQPIPAGSANRMSNGGWQPQPGGQAMVSQQSPIIQPPTTGTPQSVNSMPPPQPPTANAGRQPPPSPQAGNAAPPTPQPPTKAAPKKKETKDRAKRPNKKTAAAAAAAAANNTTATPSSEAEQPPTPTPATPITPQHHQSFNKSGANATATAPPQPTSAPAQQTLVQPPPPDQTQQSFNDLAMPDASAFSLDFSALENPDILENFDFDTFLNTDTDTAGFGFDPSITYPDGVETGTENGL
ncbi:putative cAMP-dependent protein kinase pathway protein (Som1) [Aspergillus mulundensis]|uniref:Uncharacterized protein n=1 Tax=Aspergillus mulundensis TaxID=1810919 RepID=A0A3D8QHE6_9EURO|nr:hypothetical protein DSM5745_10754 [Aspergillus mulundensis]RDW61256.1 hypothetical protein DSM5745_10754 [Aspergillus mulundensis]